MDKNIISMAPLDIVLSFVISYVAGIIPNDWFIGHDSMEEKLKECFKRALKKWTNDTQTQNVMFEKMDVFIPKLKDYIVHKHVGRHPKENALLKFWADEIINDDSCKQFILDYQHQIIILKLDENFLTAKEILSDITKQNEEVDEIKVRLTQLSNRGLISGEKYWEQWSVGPCIKLNTNILLVGRENEKEKLISCCYTPTCIYIEAASTKEAMAFAVASIINESDILIKRTIVVKSEDAYKDMVENCSGIIFITDIQENAYYAVSRGHSVVLCVCPSDRHDENSTIHLPILNRDGFIESLAESGIDKAKARNYALDSARDIYVLRHLLGFTDALPTWQTPENIRLIIPALLLGEWNEEWQNDKELVSLITGIEYVDYIEKITPLLFVDEAPLVRIGGVLKVKSPLDLMNQVIDYIPQSQIDTFKDIIELILQDDDPEAKEKMDITTLRWWQNKQMFSGNIKEGVFQSLTLLAIVQSRIHSRTNWIEKFVDDKLKDFDIKRYLTHKCNLHWLAEASPSSFLKFIKNDIKSGSVLLNQLMEVKHKDLSIIGSEIYYAELLFILEALAWDEQYLLEVTDILMYLCSYPNDSNYSNKPKNSLVQIYRLFLPQTYASFDSCLKILQNLSSTYQSLVFELCVDILGGIKNRTFSCNSHFRWRMREKKESPKYIRPINENNVKAISQLMFETSSFSHEEIWKMLNLSFDKNMNCCRSRILDVVNGYKNQLKGNDEFVENLRKEIKKQIQYKTSSWALKEYEIKQYKELLDNIESDDILQSNKHYFEDFLVKEPDWQNYEVDYSRQIKESRYIRAAILKDIINNRGFEAVWEFEKEVSYNNGIADALIELYGIELRKEIYERFCIGLLNESFVQHYFRILYNEIEETEYLSYIDELRAISEENIFIVLSAPGYQKTLSDLAVMISHEVEKKYWIKVDVWQYDDDSIDNIIKKLLYVERYKDILHIVAYNRSFNRISETLKITVLCKMTIEGKWEVLNKNIHQVTEILKTISLPENEKQRNLLLQMEFVLFDQLRHYMSKDKIHILQVVNRDPALLMELIRFVYKADEGYEENSQSEFEQDTQMALWYLSNNFFLNYDQVPCSDALGNVDEEALLCYLEELQQLAEKYHRIHILPFIIGKILGNFKETKDYPSDILCHLVERFDNDEVDSGISCALFNRRGMSSRAYNEGGTVEREYIKTFKKYKERTCLRSVRLTRIFDGLIKEYEHLAEMEDNQAKLLDYKN